MKIFFIYVRCDVRYMKFIRITWQYIIFRLRYTIHLSVSSSKVSTEVRGPKPEVVYAASSPGLRILFAFGEIYLFFPANFHDVLFDRAHQQLVLFEVG